MRRQLAATAAIVLGILVGCAGDGTIRPSDSVSTPWLRFGDEEGRASLRPGVRLERFGPGPPLAYRHDEAGLVEVQGAVVATGIPVRQVNARRWLVPFGMTACRDAPDSRLQRRAAIATSGQLRPTTLEVDPTGLLAVVVDHGDVATTTDGGAEVATFTGTIVVDGVKFSASPNGCENVSPSTGRRYTSKTFNQIIEHPPQSFARWPADSVIESSGLSVPAEFELEFSRFEPDPAVDHLLVERKAVVILNGGGFIVGDDAGRAQQRSAAIAWAQAGWVAFTVEYPTYASLSKLTDPARRDVLLRRAMEDSVRTTLTFLEFLTDRAEQWGIDSQAVVLTGWSASGVTVIESAAERWHSDEGFTAFPKFRLALSAAWSPDPPQGWRPGRPLPAAERSPLNARGEPALAMIHFERDYGDMPAMWEETCDALTDGGIACERIGLAGRGSPGEDHDLWQIPVGQPSPTTGVAVVSCFDLPPGSAPSNGCTVLDQALKMAHAATPQLK